MRRVPPLLLVAAGFAACVSLEEAAISRGAVQPDQRTVLLVYSPPSPFFSEDDSKAETAAKIVPGLGLVVAGAQVERDVRQSKELQRYIPGWNAAERFEPVLRKELGLSGWPGRFVSPEEAELPAAELSKMNAATDMGDWRERYYLGGPELGVQRNYSRFLPLDDALVFEANVAPGAVSDGEGEITPTLGLVVKLYRANNMRLLWRHESALDDPNAKRSLYEYKTNPTWLLGAWEALMPGLAQKAAEALRKNLQAAELFKMPGESVGALDAPVASSGTAVAPAVSTGTALAPAASTGTATAAAYPTPVSTATAAAPPPNETTIR